MTTRESALILIVDDDYDFLEINRMILGAGGLSRGHGGRAEAGPRPHGAKRSRTWSSPT